MKWLRELSLRNKFFLIIFLILLILIFSLVSFWFGMRVMSSIRAYVGGEGLWSKAQKEAVISLVQYMETFDERDYERYRMLLSIPLGDKQARLELEKKHPNLQIAEEGFIKGGNHPDDVDDLIFLYQRFRRVSYMEKAIHTWEDGDRGITSLQLVGEQIHTIVTDSPNSNAALLAKKRAELAPLMTEVYRIDNQLTILENQFSAVLGEAGRQIGGLLIVITSVLMMLFGVTTVIVALVIETILFQTDKSKTEFVSLTSHQLRTPITVISWYLERILKKRDEISSSQREYLQEVYAACKRMVNLINDLLNTSRIELGTMKGEIIEVNATAIADQVIKELIPQQEAKNVTIERQYQEQLPHMFADPKLLTMIFQNLLSNAVKYSKPQGKVILRMSSGKRNFSIEVGDTGCGIPLNQQAKIFSKMFRADNARVLDPEGTGLGLYIVKAIIDGTGGKIWFTSKENEGTVFYVVFPLIGMLSNRG